MMVVEARVLASPFRGCVQSGGLGLWCPSIWDPVAGTTSGRVAYQHAAASVAAVDTVP